MTILGSFSLYRIAIPLVTMKAGIGKSLGLRWVLGPVMRSLEDAENAE